MFGMNLRIVVFAVCTVLFLTSYAVATECDDPLDLGRGAIDFFVPSSYDPALSMPLVIALHHGGGSAQGEEAYFRFLPLAEQRGFLYAVPEGTRNTAGQRWWYGTTNCSIFPGDPPDDAGYLKSLIDTIKSRCNVDARRVYFVGHSSGAFMSYRMACEYSESVSALASIAGSTYYEDSLCQPQAPVHVLQIHGTSDESVSYEGGELWCGGFLPSAEETVEKWASYNRCDDPPLEILDALDFDSSIPGNETDITRYRAGCRAGSSAELWAIEGGRHEPRINDASRAAIVDHLLSCLGCSGRERLKRIRCTDEGRLLVKLRRGLSGDTYRLKLSSGKEVEGQLNGRGAATLRIKKTPSGNGKAIASWGCGAKAKKKYTCP
jgi:polyhydroxybutyrate depolymerase